MAEKAQFKGKEWGQQAVWISGLVTDDAVTQINRGNDWTLIIMFSMCRCGAGEALIGHLIGFLLHTKQDFKKSSIRNHRDKVIAIYWLR
jgi:hypothetical protein